MFCWYSLLCTHLKHTCCSLSFSSSLPRQDSLEMTITYGDGDGLVYDPLSLDIDVVVR